MTNILEPVARVSLKRRALTASVWSVSGYVVSFTIRFGSNLLLTRLLAPKMFGIMAISTIVMTALAMFSDLGVKQNIIQRKHGGDAAFLNTAWSVQIIRGGILWCCALCISAIVFLAGRTGVISLESVYADPNLPYVIAISSLVAVISGFESTKLSEANRDLALSRVVQIEITSQIVGLFCMLVWACFDRSIWLLVAGGISSTIASVSLSHIVLSGTSNRWKWDRSALHEVIHFGKWIFLNSILQFLSASGDRLLLGLFVSSNVFGIYVVAYLISSSAELILSRVIVSITFPALSEIVRERPAQLRRNYYKIYASMASPAYFGAGILMISGQSLVDHLYDARYVQAGWMLQMLAIGLITVPPAVAVQCFMALGMPHLPARIAGIRAAALFVTMPIGFHFFGLTGALAGIVLSRAVTVPTIFVYSAKHGFFDSKKELALLPIILVGAGVGAAINCIISGRF